MTEGKSSTKLTRERLKGRREIVTDRIRKRGERKEKHGEKARERWRKEKAGEC